MERLNKINKEELKEIENYQQFKNWLMSKEKMQRALYVFAYTRKFEQKNTQTYFLELTRLGQLQFIRNLLSFIDEMKDKSPNEKTTITGLKNFVQNLKDIQKGIVNINKLQGIKVKPKQKLSNSSNEQINFQELKHQIQQFIDEDLKKPKLKQIFIPIITILQIIYKTVLKINEVLTQIQKTTKSIKDIINQIAKIVKSQLQTKKWYITIPSLITMFYGSASFIVNFAYIHDIDTNANLISIFISGVTFIMGFVYFIKKRCWDRKKKQPQGSKQQSQQMSSIKNQKSSSFSPYALEEALVEQKKQPMGRLQ